MDPEGAESFPPLSKKGSTSEKKGVYEPFVAKGRLRGGTTEEEEVESFPPVNKGREEEEEEVMEMAPDPEVYEKAPEPVFELSPEQKPLPDPGDAPADMENRNHYSKGW